MPLLDRLQPHWPKVVASFSPANPRPSGILPVKQDKYLYIFQADKGILEGVIALPVGDWQRFVDLITLVAAGPTQKPVEDEDELE